MSYCWSGCASHTSSCKWETKGTYHRCEFGKINVSRWHENWMLKCCVVSPWVSKLLPSHRLTDLNSCNSWLIWPFFPSSAFSTSFCNALALQLQHIRLEIHDFPINTEERKIKFNEKNEFKFNLKNEGWNLNYSQIIILWYKHHG